MSTHHAVARTTPFTTDELLYALGTAAARVTHAVPPVVASFEREFWSCLEGHSPGTDMDGIYQLVMVPQLEDALDCFASQFFRLYVDAVARQRNRSVTKVGFFFTKKHDLAILCWSVFAEGRELARLEFIKRAKERRTLLSAQQSVLYKEECETQSNE